MGEEQEISLGEKRKAIDMDPEKYEVDLSSEEIILKNDPYVYFPVKPTL
jgi:hypothetical protein